MESREAARAGAEEKEGAAKEEAAGSSKEAAEEQQQRKQQRWNIHPEMYEGWNLSTLRLRFACTV